MTEMWFLKAKVSEAFLPSFLSFLTRSTVRTVGLFTYSRLINQLFRLCIYGIWPRFAGYVRGPGYIDLVA